MNVSQAAVINADVEVIPGGTAEARDGTENGCVISLPHRK
jgi:hypothetical protein